MGIYLYCGNCCGCYAALSYFFTGESMHYNFPRGEFANISHIDNKKFGAWQILARVSYLNLNDKDIYAGKETNATIGLNWYVNKFVTLKADYIRIMATLPQENNPHENNNVFAMRIQARF